MVLFNINLRKMKYILLYVLNKKLVLIRFEYLHICLYTLCPTYYP